MYPYECESPVRFFHVEIRDPCLDGKDAIDYITNYGTHYFDICECVWEETQEIYDYTGYESTETFYIPSTWDGFDIAFHEVVPSWVPFPANNCTGQYYARMISLYMDN